MQNSIIWTGLGTVLVVAILIWVLRSDSIPTSPQPMQVNPTTAVKSAPELLQNTDEDFDLDTAESITDTNETESSVWDLCDVEEFPLDKESAVDFVDRLELSQECEDALAAHVLSTNPFKLYKQSVYPFGLTRKEYTGNEFSLMVLDQPMTFDRVFSDPAGDLERIVDALSRPECLIEDDSKVNWEKKDYCHASAFTNFAVFTDACHSRSAEQYLSKTQNSLSAAVWGNYLSYRWIDIQCREFDVELKQDDENFLDHWKSMFSHRVEGHDPDSQQDEDRPRITYRFDPLRLLVRGASLGDEAASLTDQGLYYGPFVQIFFINPTWKDLSEQKPLNKERLRQAFNFVLYLESIELDFDLDWFVKHLVTSNQSDVRSENQSLRSLIYDFYTVDKISGSQLEVLNRIKSIAIELDVYD